ncbi:MAG: SLC26A/SulP transporter family protein, partial [Spirochaetales bacterium]|nr:SLC26A/SulP transporter family protein [Spirochaetales bacterium]
TGVGLLIFIGQIPKWLAVPEGTRLFAALMTPSLWDRDSIIIGTATILAMIFIPRFFKAIPAVIVALAMGVAAYFALALFQPSLRTLSGNTLVIGEVQAGPAQVWEAIKLHWSPASVKAAFGNLSLYTVPVLTLAVLLSIDALKTCVVLDVLTGERHNSNRVLIGQGVGNGAASLFGGVPGAGTMGPSLINFTSGARTSRSGVFMGLISLVTLFALGPLISWIPLASLSGVLIVVGIRMMDFKAFRLLKNRSTLFDFLVIMAVVVAAVTKDLIIAAGVGIAMAIILFLREQIRFSVIRRTYDATRVHSKRQRLHDEMKALEEQGSRIVVFELQGQLFFGTADQLYTELEPSLSTARFVILDMQHVLAIDYTAVNVLRQIHNRLKKNRATLVLSQVSAGLAGHRDIGEYLEELNFREDGSSLIYIADLDTALERTENIFLEEIGALAPSDDKPLKAEKFEFFSAFPKEAVKPIVDIMESVRFVKGNMLFRKGDVSKEMYFIRKGIVKIVLPIEGSGISHHLATFSRGDFLGEMAFLDKAPRSADAVCAEDTEFYILKRKAFRSLLAVHPEMGTLFYAYLARTISDRLRLNHAEIQALEGKGLPGEEEEDIG